VRRVVLPDGVSLHTEVIEPVGFRPGIDPTLVFAHGFALNSTVWHYQRRDLDGLGRMVFYDQRSHGRSDRAPDGTHTIDQLGQDLAAVVADTAPAGPIILIGHSMGGMTVMSLIEHQPDLVGRRVVGAALLATSPGQMNTVTLGLPKSAATLMHRYAEDAAVIMGARKPLIDPVRSRSTDLSYLLTKIYSFGGWTSPSMTRFVHDMNAATPADVLAEFIPTLVQHDKLESLEALRAVPTLVLVGDHDLLTPVAHSEEILRKVPTADFVVVPESGHMVILERYADVNYRLRELFRRSLAR
jgi:pimeloyl-ACP methyl ester carboxylesterase